MYANSRILGALVRYLPDEDASAGVRRHGLGYAVRGLSRFTVSGLHNFASRYLAQHDPTEFSSYLVAVTKAICKRYYKDWPRDLLLLPRNFKIRGRQGR